MDLADLLDRDSVSRVCQKHGVQRLRVFGSVLTDQFDPARSDVDFLVDFLPDRADPFEDFFGLREELSRLTSREIDLVVAHTMRNPYFKAALRDAEDIYTAEAVDDSNPAVSSEANLPPLSLP